MSWAYGVSHAGREVGYSIRATCDEKGCRKRIDRGLAYVCGGMHDGGDLGCGNYYCYAHLFLGAGAQLCRTCHDQALATATEPTASGRERPDGGTEVEVGYEREAK